MRIALGSRPLQCLVAAVVLTSITGCPPWRPKERVVFSNNGRFALEVSPQRETILVFDVDQHQREKYRVSYNVWNDGCLVTDDGERVITFFNGPRHMLTGDVVLRFWNDKGVIKEHALASLVRDNRLSSKVGTSTTFSFTPWYHQNMICNDELWVVTIDGADLRFSLTTGELLPLDAPGGNRWAIFWLRAWPTIVGTVLIGIPIVCLVWTIIKTIRSNGRT